MLHGNNAEAWDVFEDLLAQSGGGGLGGFSGFRFESLPFLLQLHQIPEGAWRELVGKLRVICAAFMASIAKSTSES